MVEVRKAGRTRRGRGHGARPADRREPHARARASGPQADINLHLTCEAPPGEVASWSSPAMTGEPAVLAATVAVRRHGRPARPRSPGSDEDAGRLARILADRFGTDATKEAAAAKLLAEVPWVESMPRPRLGGLQGIAAHESLRQEFEAKTVATKDRTSPYLWRHVGEKPQDGWAPGHRHARRRQRTEAAVNDQQWQGMFKRYYKDHPEAGGYVYLSLRAPNDAWNGFYDDAICPLVERLIRQFVILRRRQPRPGLHPGASHGGYGAFVIGPKMPDRFAAVHASAAAPTRTARRRARTCATSDSRSWSANATPPMAGPSVAWRSRSRFEGWRRSFGGYPGRFRVGAGRRPLRCPTATRSPRCSGRAAAIPARRASSGPSPTMC